MPKPAIKAAQAQIDAAFQNMERVLTDAIIESCRVLSRRHKGKKVVFSSGMGAWSWHVDGKEKFPSVHQTLEELCSRFDYEGIPVGVIECADGEISHFQIGYRSDAAPRFVVLSKVAARSPSYRRVAVCQVQDPDKPPRMISPVSTGMVRIIRVWEDVPASGKQTKYLDILSAAHAMADRLNAAVGAKK